MKVVQINAVYEFSSTGRTTKEMHNYLLQTGNKSWVFCSNQNTKIEKVYNIGGKLNWNFHAFMSRLLGLQSYFSYFSTKKMLSQLDKIQPDIVHLRNLHANYINLPLLLKYLAKRDIATVLTLHDCWFFTGHCCYYTADNCEKWITGCGGCPILHKYNKSWFFDRTRKAYRDKKQLFSSIKKLAVVGNSEWTTNQARESFLKTAKVVTRIYNWIDLNVFYPKNIEHCRIKYGLDKYEFTVIGVAQGWSIQKGLGIHIEIAKRMSNIKIILVGSISEESKAILPSNILCVGKLSSTAALAEYYSLADVFINPSIQETFGKVSAEALACGTPLIVNNATANPELAEDGCGYIVDNNDIESYIEYLNIIKSNGKSAYTDSCISKAKSQFEMIDNIEKYISLYNTLLK